MPTALDITLPALVSEMTIWSAFSPPVTIDVRDALSPSPKGAPPTLTGQFLTAIRPAVRMQGIGVGDRTLAPYGQAPIDAWKVNLSLLGVGAAILGGLIVMSIYKVGAFSARKGAKK